jgi:hypothetical protein
MTFEEWWAQQPKDVTRPIGPREAWEAATAIERMACADLCQRAGDTFLAQERFMPDNQKADAGQVAGACRFAILARSNAELRGG